MFITNRYIDRGLSIQFRHQEPFEEVMTKEQWCIILVTNGEGWVKLNGERYCINKGVILCLTSEDQYQWDIVENIVAQSFIFHPQFLDGRSLEGKEARQTEVVEDFFRCRDIHKGVYRIPIALYERIRDWFFIIGTEIYAQSDPRWVSHIKNELIHILESVAIAEDEIGIGIKKVLNYIHLHYKERIRLDMLTQCASLNRNVLNKAFKQYFNKTVMEYLLYYRMRIAEDLLTYSPLSLNDIARHSGFRYDTYMIKQFIRKKGISPTQYRRISRQYGESIGRETILVPLPENEE